MKFCLVYCGSASGKDPIYLKTARELGENFRENDFGLVYGGHKAGLMGALANGVLNIDDDSTGNIGNGTNTNNAEDDKSDKNDIAAPASSQKKGHVIGVSPHNGVLLKTETKHENLTELISVSSFAERKQIMFDKSDYIICLPGGMGSLDELSEVLCSCSLGHHKKPIILFNVKNYWGKLIELAEHMKIEGFTHGKDMPWVVVETVDELMQHLIRLRAAEGT